MKNYAEILRAIEDSTKDVKDPDLRKVAFQELLRHALEQDGTTKKAVSPAVPRIVESKAARKKPARLRGSSASGVRAEVVALDLDPDHEGLPRWDTLKFDWKKFCWILEAARKNGVDGLTNTEISFLAEKVFRENHPVDRVNNLRQKIRQGIVKSATIRSGDKQYQVWKILSGGTKVLEQPNPPQAK